MKRTFDFAVALALTLLLSPAIMATAAVIAWRMGLPVLFRQQRPGLHGRPFVLLKFRTMTSGVDAGGRPLSDGARLTPLGSFLRRASLDELPQLINVIRGDMSLVGPRPLLMEYLPLYTPEQARRHAVRPGITGWAQVNGRNAITWEEKFRLDVWYVDHRSLLLDFRILWMTLGRLFQPSGIAQEGHATMPNFTGSKPGDERRD
ncbi:MAG: sugar transferase [Rhodocyclales bacterium]|nr:sugar transferase [Rhodocyclales bacterium]